MVAEGDKALLRHAGIDDAEIAGRSAMFGLSDDDVHVLKGIRPLILPVLEEVAQDFFSNIGTHFEVNTVIGDSETLARLEVSLRQYVLELFSGDYGPSYVAGRLRVGKVHQRIGVLPKLFTFGLFLLRRLLENAIDEQSAAAGEGHLAERRKDSLDKILALDSHYVLESYMDFTLEAVSLAK